MNYLTFVVEGRSVIIKKSKLVSVNVIYIGLSLYLLISVNITNFAYQLYRTLATGYKLYFSSIQETGSVT